MEVDRTLLGELEAMGFSEALAMEALRSSGNSSIEDAINWLVDHDSDTTLSEPPMQSESLVDVSIEAYKAFHISEQVKLKAQALRSQARRKKAEKEKKLEREREKERIRTGKELLEAKRIAEESERKRFLAQRKVEKEEERRARDRVRQKLQQDKLERRGILGLPTEVPVPVKPDTAMQERTKNLEQVDPACLPAAVREHMRECLRSLKRENKIHGNAYPTTNQLLSSNVSRKCIPNDESTALHECFLNVFVKNMSESTTDEDDDLKRIFGEYGAITSSVVMRDADGKSKCFGFPLNGVTCCLVRIELQIIEAITDKCWKNRIP